METNKDKLMNSTATPSDTAPVAPGQGDTAQPAPAQPGVTVQPAPGQGETPQPAPVTPATDKGPIPYERFDEVNKKAKQYEEQVGSLQAQLMQMQQFVQQLAQTQPRQTPQQPQTPLARYRENPNDLLDPAKQLEAMQVMYDDLQQKLQAAIGQVQFQSQYGDFSQLVGSQNPITGQFVPSEIMAEAFKENPRLASALQSGDQRALAYEIAGLHKKLREARIPKPNPTPPAPVVPPVQVVAQQIRAAQAAPVSIGAATGTGQIDRSNAVQTMPEAEFQQRLARAKAGGSFW